MSEQDATPTPHPHGPAGLTLRSPGGSDAGSGFKCRKSGLFQSTLPVGGATCSLLPELQAGAISIHAPRGGSDIKVINHRIEDLISIHAPRGGSDSVTGMANILRQVFQSTLPLGGATRKILTSWTISWSFQSTLPVGGATIPDGYLHFCPSDFNPRSPWGERQLVYIPFCYPPIISIHAPRGGERLDCHRRAGVVLRISIHAPRGGSDVGFQLPHAAVQFISIHAPRGGSDCTPMCLIHYIQSFQSTLPVGERQ